MRKLAIGFVGALAIVATVVPGAGSTNGYFVCQGANQVNGTAGDDNLRGGSSQDALNGMGGHDRLDAGSNHDCLSGGSGDDRLNAGSGDDELVGGNGDDVFSGGSGDDDIDAYDGLSGAGEDVISAGSGDDYIEADDGHFDEINCGSDVDTVFADEFDDVASNCENVFDNGNG